MRTAHLLAALLLTSACGGYETGVDRTVLDGTLYLMPVSATEAETAEGDNDDVTLAQDLGPLGFQVIALTGTSLKAGNFANSPSGDLDWYTFTPAQDGTTAMSILYPGDPTVSTESVVMDIVIEDLSALDDTGAPTVVYASNTKGDYGDAEISLDVTGGDTYAMRLAETTNSSGDTSYTVVAYGFDPNGTQFLVGAYAESDIFSRGDPLGGTSVETFTMDQDLAWEGSFEILYIRSLVTTTDTAGNETNDLNEAISQVYLHAGDFSSLNAGVLAGNLYSSTPTEVQLSTDDATTDLHKDLTVACDTVQPIQFGWTYTETEPNDVALDGTNYVLTGDLSAANVLPMGSGAGYVDVVEGSLDYPEADPQWSADNDVFALTVPAETSANITLGWADAAADIDLLMFDETGALLAYAATSDNPEIVNLADFGFAMEPGSTYYFQVLGWGGPVGTEPYTMKIEYTSP